MSVNHLKQYSGNRHKAGNDTIHIKHPGLLHKKMGIPQGEKIPRGALAAEKAKAERTGDTSLIKETTFAENFGKKGQIMTVTLTKLTKHQWGHVLKVVAWLVVAGLCAGATAWITHNSAYLATLPGWNVLGVLIEGILTNEQETALTNVPASVVTEAEQVVPALTPPTT